MRDSLDIVNSSPVLSDSIQAIRYHKHYYKPAYPDGLTDSIPGAVTYFKPLQTYPLIEDRQGVTPQTYNPTPAHSSVMMILLVFVFLLIAYCARKGSNFFMKIRNSLLSIKRRENTFDEHTSNEAVLMIALLTLSVIMGGIIIYCSLSETLQGVLHLSMPVAVMFSIVIAVSLFLFQLVVATFTSFIFSSADNTRLWIYGLTSAQIYFGLSLTPIALLMLFSPEYNKLLLQIAIVLYIIARIISLIKGRKMIFVPYFFSMSKYGDFSVDGFG